MTALSLRTPLTAVQRTHWYPEGDRHRRGLRAHVGALRITGDVDPGRLVAAIDEVVDATDILRAGFDTSGPGGSWMIGDRTRPAVRQHRVDSPDADADRVRILRADRDTATDPTTDPLVRLHLLRRGRGELVFAVVADPLVLDLRSTYLVLGAVLQAAAGRYRPESVPAHDEVWQVLDERLPRLTPARRAWWTARLREWGALPAVAVPAPPRPVRTLSLRLDEQRWSQLGSGGAAPTGWLAVIAALAWSLRSGPSGAAVLTGGLDLREVLGLGPAVGPLTDQVVFDVDLSGMVAPTAAELVLRSHAGLLDGVVHHVAYAELAALGEAVGAPVPPRPGRAGHLVVHHCRLPPSSRHTRDDAGLARFGFSVELFGQAALVAAASATAAVEVHLAESGSDVELIVDHDPAVVPAERADALLADVRRLVEAWSGDPDGPRTAAGPC